MRSNGKWTSTELPELKKETPKNGAFASAILMGDVPANHGAGNPRAGTHDPWDPVWLGDIKGYDELVME